MAIPIVEFQDVTLGYGHHIALSGLSLRVERGDFLGIVGPNGAGKTTLLKGILGVLRPSRGVVDRDESVRFGYVPQQQRLDDVFPLTVMDITMMGRYPLMGIFGRPRDHDRSIVMQSLQNAGIADLADRLYKELSGGQKQRVLIARALAGEPQALVLDEPTNDMDVAGEYAVMELLRGLHEANGITVVIVSHLLNVVSNYAGKMIIISNGVTTTGSTREVITADVLEVAYGVPVTVTCCNGRTVALAGGKNAGSIP